MAKFSHAKAAEMHYRRGRKWADIRDRQTHTGKRKRT
jgi:hypothetical protein